jgi:uncharacterized metal-binding protein YceD (DUF177 family)
MSEAEFSRVIDRRHISGQPLELKADEAERRALAKRFGLVSIDQLSARLQLESEADVVAVQGRLAARIVQSCAISGEDLQVTVDEPLAFRFVPQAEITEEEIELEEQDLDEIGYTGHTFDLGEAVAQTLALSIDPYATGPQADRARKEAGITDEAASGAFAALAALRKD